MPKRAQFLAPIQRLVSKHPNAILLLGTFLVGVVYAIAATILVDGRSDALRRAEENARNVVLIVEHDTLRNIEIYDLSLREVVRGMERPDIVALPTEYRHMILFDASGSAAHLGSLLVLDADGNVREDSGHARPRTANLGDRDYFTVHRDNPHAGLYVSRPFRSRLRAGALSVALSRRISGPDGSFAGVAVGTMNLSYFKELFEGVNVGSNGVLSLIRTDGTMMMRVPNSEALVGKNLRGTPNFEHFAHGPEAPFVGNATLDGVRRVYVFRRLPNVPLIVSLGLGEREIYAEWTRRAVLMGSLMAIFGLFFICLSGFLSAELKRRVKLERELRAFSQTDALTGLSNRRTLDASLEREWSRARRGGAALAILFIDIDHFKAYNDQYGHPAGDDALAVVAQAIGRSIRRPLDTAARYGGEEFVVVLPETDADGAARVAETIRARVQALALAHAGSAHHGCVTVSIGVASLERPASAPATLAEFVKAADQALYAAKHHGRNRVSVAAVTAGSDAPHTA